MAATQSNRQVSVNTALGADVLLFASMHGTEQLGRLSQFTVTMESENHNIQIADVLGKPLEVVLVLENGTDKRYFNGVVTQFCHTGSNKTFSTYKATVRPGLWLLSRASNCRIFQDLSAPAIVKQVCDAYGSDVVLDLGALSQDHLPLPYCVQYRETDLDFVCRLMEQSGIYFYFTHSSGRHTTVLADSYTTHQPIPGYEAMQVCTAPGDLRDFVDWTVSGAITTSKYDLNDFDFEKALSSSGGGLRTTASFGQASYTMYDYPGKYQTTAAGNAIALARLESEHGQGEAITASANARGLYPGGLFSLVEHPRADANRTYLVTSASYAITGDDYVSGDRAFSFACQVTAIDNGRAFRPVRSVAPPVVPGPQTAIVVGKPGEEIWTDKYGRIKVQFHWDRAGASDEKSSCWVRVAQGWAGRGWGAMAIPRVGMEVVVSFLEGDPDRPLVTGCVYNGDAMPPYPLPTHQTRSTLKSQSSKGGEGFNELRFEDKKGAEEVFMHAERDFLRVVKNNDALKVGFETADKGDQTVDIKNDQTISIGHDAVASIDNNQTVTIKADDKLDVGGDQAVGIDGDQKVKVGKTVVIEAGTSIELKVGGSSIKIEAGKITIKAAEIEIAADANAKVKAGAMMEIKSGAVMTIGGAMVQIN